MIYFPFYFSNKMSLLNSLKSVLPDDICTDTFDLRVGKFNFLSGEKEAIEHLELQVRPEIKMYGKTVRQKRDVQFFSDEVKYYFYSGQKAESKPLPPILKSILSRVNDSFSDEFNGILVNRYNDGTQTISKHRDAERDLGRSGVVSISVGATRTFRLRDNAGTIVLDLPIHDGEIMHMSGEFQTYFTHEIIEERKVLHPRTSLTFRYHKST